MPDLLLLTNRYPYGAGEDYLAPELPHLAAAFDRVVIVPTMQTRGQTPTRAVPPGVVVVPPDLPPGWVGRLTAPLAELARGTVRMGLPHLPGPAPRGPVPHAYELYFEARSQAVVSRAAPRLAEAGIAVPEIVYAYWFHVPVRVASVLAGFRSRGRPVLVSRAHGYDVNVEASPVRYLPQRELLMGEVDRLHPVAEAVAVRLRQEWPEHAAKIAVRRLGSVGSSPAPVAQRQPLHVLTVSSVRRLRRLDLVAEAVGMLQRDGLPVRWTHLGGGSSRAMAALHRRVSGLAPGTVELAGQLPHAQVLDWYATHHPSVLVSVSTSEGVPVSIMEAMAHGLPVLATDVGGTRELLAGQPWPGLLPRDLDAAYLAGALLGLEAMPSSTYERICTANQASWRAGWQADVMLADFARELASLADEVRAGEGQEPAR